MVVAGWKETRRKRIGAWVWKKFRGKRCGREALVYSGRWGPSAAYARSSYQDALALARGTPFPMRGACWWAAAWSATCTSIVLLSVYAIVDFFRSDDDEYFIEDTSSNRTYVNGKKLWRDDKLPLKDFDAIKLTKRSHRELVFTIRIYNSQPVVGRLRFLYLDRLPDRRSSRRS